eukprot:scpid19518/ scgid4004/ Cat eye syndrome critical region protein 2
MDPKLASIDSMTGDSCKEWWQVPYIAQFCYVLKPAFHFPDFIVEDLEEALCKPAEQGSPEWKLICEIHVRMLRGILPNRGVNVENWQDHLRKLMRGKTKRSKVLSTPEDTTNENSSDSTENTNGEQSDTADSPATEENGSEERATTTDNEVWNPLEENTDYREIATRDKVAILFLLSEMRLEASDCHDALKGWDGDYLRLQPIGNDKHGHRYWFMDSGMRLYKELDPKLELPAAEEEKPVKKVKVKAKAKGKRGRGRPKAKKSSSSTSSPVDKSYARSKRSSFRSAISRISHQPESESDSDSDEQEEESKEEPFPPLMSLTTSLIGDWAVVADSQEEWEELTEKFVRSRNADERQLGKFIQSQLLEEVTKKRTLREKQLRKKQLLESMPRRASDRITIMKISREEEEKHAVQRREMAESERRQAEEERLRRISEDRREQRAKRLQARAETASAQGLSPPSENRQGPPYGMNEEKYDAMYAVLEGLRKSTHSWVFEEPVTDKIAPNYSLVVKQPMSLTTVEGKLDDYSYKHPSEFIEDLRIMCANCRLYNGPKSPYYKSADLIEGSVKRYSLKHFPRIEWGDPPILPPSDPLPTIPKPQKRKSLPDDDVDPDCPPYTKVKTPHAGPFKHPKTEASSSEFLNTHLSRHHPVAGHGNSFVQPDQHQPAFAQHQLMTGAPMNHQPPNVRPSVHPGAGLGAWGQVMTQPAYGNVVQRMPHQPVMPGVPVPRAPVNSTMVARHPGAMSGGAVRQSVPVVNGHVARHGGGSSPVRPIVTAQHKPGNLRMDSPSTQPDSSHRVNHAGMVSSNGPSPLGGAPARPRAYSPGGNPAPSASAGNHRLASFSSAGASHSAVSSYQHASRPLSSGPVPRAPVAASSLHSMSRPLSAAVAHRPILPHPASVPVHRPSMPSATAVSRPECIRPIPGSDASSSGAVVQQRPTSMASHAPTGAAGATAATHDHNNGGVSSASTSPGAQPVSAAAPASTIPSSISTPPLLHAQQIAESASSAASSVSSAIHQPMPSSAPLQQQLTSRPSEQPPSTVSEPRVSCNATAAGVLGDTPASISTAPVTSNVLVHNSVSNALTTTIAVPSAVGMSSAASAAAGADNSATATPSRPSSVTGVFPERDSFACSGGTDALDQLAAVSAQASPVHQPAMLHPGANSTNSTSDDAFSVSDAVKSACLTAQENANADIGGAGSNSTAACPAAVPSGDAACAVKGPSATSCIVSSAC